MIGAMIKFLLAQKGNLEHLRGCCVLGKARLRCRAGVVRFCKAFKLHLTKSKGCRSVPCTAVLDR